MARALPAWPWLLFGIIEPVVLYVQRDTPELTTLTNFEKVFGLSSPSSTIRRTSSPEAPHLSLPCQRCQAVLQLSSISWPTFFFSSPLCKQCVAGPPMWRSHGRMSPSLLSQIWGIFILLTWGWGRRRFGIGSTGTTSLGVTLGSVPSCV